MYLVIDGSLALPPSSTSCFRDVTLFAKSFTNFTPIVECKRSDRDLIWKWLKINGGLDFVEDVTRRNVVTGVTMSYRKRCNICVTRIGYNNLNFILNRLKQLSVNHPEIDFSSLLDDLS